MNAASWSRCVLAFLLLARHAVAAPPTDSERAQVLFDEAVRLLEAGAFAEACPALAESQRLDPAGGTLLNLAFCFEKLEQWESAVNSYREALKRAELDGREDRRAVARAGLSRVIVRVPRLHIIVPSELSDGRDWAVWVDNQRLTPDELAGALPVALGVHRIRASGPAVVTLDVQHGWQEATEFAVQLAPLPRPVSATPGASSASAQRAPSATPASSPARRHLPTAFWAAAGVAGSLLVVGGATGLVAASEHASAMRSCPNDRCTSAGVAAEARANRWAWGANASVGLGVAGLAVAAYFLLQPSSSAPRTALEWSF